MNGYESDLGFARIDHGRRERRGLPEAVYSEGKDLEHLRAIAADFREVGSPALFTRLDPAGAEVVLTELPGATWHERPRMLTWEPPGERARLEGVVAVLCAGTTDLPVAEEAAVTAAFYGCEVRRIPDVGVAGLHRLLSRLDEVRAADCLIVVAGMDGALPSVVSGLVAAPVIAVPTSVGYGAALGGMAALMTMLVSCSPGVAVVNIDNGFGAGHLAAQMLGIAERRAVRTAAR